MTSFTKIFSLSLSLFFLNCIVNLWASWFSDHCLLHERSRENMTWPAEVKGTHCAVLWAGHNGLAILDEGEVTHAPVVLVKGHEAETTGGIPHLHLKQQQQQDIVISFLPSATPATKPLSDIFLPATTATGSVINLSSRCQGSNRQCYQSIILLPRQQQAVLSIYHPVAKATTDSVMNLSSCCQCNNRQCYQSIIPLPRQQQAVLSIYHPVAKAATGSVINLSSCCQGNNRQCYQSIILLPRQQQTVLWIYHPVAKATTGSVINLSSCCQGNNRQCYQSIILLPRQQQTVLSVICFLVAKATTGSVISDLFSCCKDNNRQCYQWSVSPLRLQPCFLFSIFTILWKLIPLVHVINHWLLKALVVCILTIYGSSICFINNATFVKK